MRKGSDSAGEAVLPPAGIGCTQWKGGLSTGMLTGNSGTKPPGGASMMKDTTFVSFDVPRETRRGV